MSLPRVVERTEPDRRRFAETVVFVPFYEGKIQNLKRHVEFVRSLGFSAVSFEYSPSPTWTSAYLPFSRRGHWGIKHIGADIIEDVLMSVKGPKIVYAFSNPGSSAIEAISRRISHFDISALVCDSGPFNYFYYCNSNRLFFDKHVTSMPKRIALNLGERAIWSRDPDGTLAHDLDLLPDGFRILSIRGGKDLLVPPWAIDAVFRNHANVIVETLTLDQAGHLRGLKDFPRDYTPPVARFLESVGRKI